jgi:hypothetical protein
MVTHMMFAEHRYSSELKIGVAKNKDGKLDAHAWVESQGQVLIGNLHDLSRFEPLIGWNERIRGWEDEKGQ